MSQYKDQVGMTYADAVTYLKSIGKWEDVIKSADSDGYSIIAVAIYFRKKEESRSAVYKRTAA